MHSPRSSYPAIPMSSSPPPAAHGPRNPIVASETAAFVRMNELVGFGYMASSSWLAVAGVLVHLLVILRMRALA